MVKQNETPYKSVHLRLIHKFLIDNQSIEGYMVYMSVKHAIVGPDLQSWTRSLSIFNPRTGIANLN
jgi:hypothetical protein